MWFNLIKVTLPNSTAGLSRVLLSKFAVQTLHGVSQEPDILSITTRIQKSINVALMVQRFPIQSYC